MSLPIKACGEEVKATLNLGTIYKTVNILSVHGLSVGLTGTFTHWTKREREQRLT